MDTGVLWVDTDGVTVLTVFYGATAEDALAEFDQMHNGDAAVADMLGPVCPHPCAECGEPAAADWLVTYGRKPGARVYARCDEHLHAGSHLPVSTTCWQGDA